MHEPRTADARRQRLAPSAETPLIDGLRFDGWPGLPGVLWAGLRALTMLPVRPGASPARALWTIVLAVAIHGVAIIGDALILGEAAAGFNWPTLRAGGLDLAILVLASVWLAEPRSKPAREPVPPLHFATVVLAATFWTVLASYAVTWSLDRQVEADLDAILPGLWFYAWFSIWPWWVAIRAIQYQHRYQPIPWWRRLIVIAVMLGGIIWSLLDPGEPYWIYDEPIEPNLLYTGGTGLPSA